MVIFYKAGDKRYDHFRKEKFIIRKRILDCLYSIQYEDGRTSVEHVNFIESNTESFNERKERIGMRLIK